MGDKSMNTVRWRRFPRKWLIGALVVVVGGSVASIVALVPRSSRAVPGPAVIRRLTADQYRNIVADIFGEDIDLGGRLPPDSRVDGLVGVGASYISIAPDEMDQYDAMGRAIANQIFDAKHRGSVMSCRPDAETVFDDFCARSFLIRVGRLLYRRPLTALELQDYLKAAQVGTKLSGNYYSGMSLSVAAMLSSPKFLFRVERLTPDPGHPGEYQLDAYSKASQLSFFLWDSAPDGILLDAAAKGELNSRRGLERQVTRMMSSPRLEEGMRAFFADDLRFDEFADLTKDPILFPKFNSEVATEAREQAMRTILDVVLTRNADFRKIFTTKATFMTPDLGSIYRVPIFPLGPNGAPDAWQPYRFSANDPRGGILTQVAFTALHTPAGRSSPTIRGKALREVILCEPIPSPPGNVDFSKFALTTLGPNVTARAMLNAHATNPACAGCHRLMDPLGESLENFDAAGEYRTADHGFPIDASGNLDGVTYTNAAGMSRAIADNPATSQCLVKRLTARALGRPTTAGERFWLAQLEEAFTSNGYHMKDLMQEIAQSDALYQTSTQAPAFRRSGAFAVDAMPKLLVTDNQESPK